MEKKHKLEEIDKKIKNLLSKMNFNIFKNNKKYSFDYKFEKDFLDIKKEIENISLLRVKIKNAMPIFLPKAVTRIAFFESQAKSVKKINANSIIKALKRKSFSYQPKENDKRTIEEILENDIKIFKEYNQKYTINEYYIDNFSTSVRFNAYSSDDNMLIEKSYVLGGLVFNADEKDFSDKIIISYPHHRKQRSDKKNNYIGLSLLNIRPILK